MVYWFLGEIEWWRVLNWYEYGNEFFDGNNFLEELEPFFMIFGWLARFIWISIDFFVCGFLTECTRSRWFLDFFLYRSLMRDLSIVWMIISSLFMRWINLYGLSVPLIIFFPLCLRRESCFLWFVGGCCFTRQTWTWWLAATRVSVMTVVSSVFW